MSTYFYREEEIDASTLGIPQQPGLPLKPINDSYLSRLWAWIQESWVLAFVLEPFGLSLVYWIIAGVLLYIIYKRLKAYFLIAVFLVLSGLLVFFALTSGLL